MMARKEPQQRICVLCCSSQCVSDVGTLALEKSSFKRRIQSQLTLLKFYNEIVKELPVVEANSRHRHRENGSRSSKTRSVSPVMPGRDTNPLEMCSVCSACFALVKTVTDLGDQVTEVEHRVRGLQSQILSELKELQRRLRRFHEEMRRIGGVVERSESICGDLLEAEEVVVLRRNISCVVNKLGAHKDQVARRVLRHRDNRKGPSNDNLEHLQKLANSRDLWRIDTSSPQTPIKVEAGERLKETDKDNDSFGEDCSVESEDDDVGVADNSNSNNEQSFDLSGDDVSSNDGNNFNVVVPRYASGSKVVKQRRRNKRKRKKSTGTSTNVSGMKILKLNPFDSEDNSLLDSHDDDADDEPILLSQDKYIGLRTKPYGLPKESSNVGSEPSSSDEWVELYRNSGVKMKQAELDAIILRSKEITFLGRNLFRALFTEEELTSHSLFGKMCNAMKIKGHVALPEIDATRRDAVINFILKEVNLDEGTTELVRRKAAKRDIIKSLSTLLREKNRKAKLQI